MSEQRKQRRPESWIDRIDLMIDAFGATVAASISYFCVCGEDGDSGR